MIEKRTRAEVARGNSEERTTFYDTENNDALTKMNDDGTFTVIGSENIPLAGTSENAPVTGNIEFQKALMQFLASAGFEIQGGGVTDYSKGWMFVDDEEASIGFGLEDGATKNGLFADADTTQVLWNNKIVFGVSADGTVTMSTKNGVARISIDTNGVLKFLNVPVASAGLPSGAVWSDGGVLTLVP